MSTTPRVTRAKNATAHPGLRHTAYNNKHRPAAEIEADKASKAAKIEEKKNKQARREVGIIKAAHVEKVAKDRAKKAYENMNHPPDTTSTKHVNFRPISIRPHTPLANILRGTQLRYSDGHTTRAVSHAEDDLNQDISSPATSGNKSSEDYLIGTKNLHKPCSIDNDTESDRDEYQENEESDNMEIDEGFNDDTNKRRPSKTMKDINEAKAKVTKEKKGVAARAAIAAIRNRMVGVVEGKRKAEPTVTNVKKKLKVSALREDWESTIETTDPTRLGHSSSAGSTLGISSAAPTDDDTDGFQPGGISSDADELELSAPVKIRQTKQMEAKTIAKVEVIHTLPEPKAKRTRNRPTLNDLPTLNHRATFVATISPMICDHTAALDPWENPTDDEMCDVWNALYDAQPMTSEPNDRFFPVVKPLMKQTLAQWVHRFASGAEKALMAEFNQHKLVSLEECATLVNMLLGDAQDFSSKKRPFLWQSTDDNDISVISTVEFSGLFMGRLVAITFSEHLQHLRGLLEFQRVDQMPVGALVLSIQAVHRALVYSTSGMFQPPGNSRLAAFSRSNWEDHQTINPNRSVQVSPRASTFLKRIHKLTPEHWEAIIKAAQAFMGESKKKRGMIEAETEQLGQLEEESDDDVLNDPLFDEPQFDKGGAKGSGEATEPQGN